MNIDEQFMLEALKEASASLAQDEVPIGAIVVKGGKIIARAHNTRNQSRSAVEHAELVAIQRACKYLNDWRLIGCDLYVTLEPCVMCLGACYNARISNIYFGAFDLSGNGCMHISEMIGRTLNHELSIHGGVLHEECSQILSSYFKSKRC